MKSYLEINVPFDSGKAVWYSELKRELRHTTARWQNAYYHITMAFLNMTPENIDLSLILKSFFDNFPAPVITFDKLDAFTTRSGTQIVFLSASNIPSDFQNLIMTVRKRLKSVGCLVQPDFKFHLTLGRIDGNDISLPDLKDIISSIDFTPFTATLTEVDYRIFRGEIIFKTTLTQISQV